MNSGRTGHIAEKYLPSITPLWRFVIGPGLQFWGVKWRCVLWVSSACHSSVDWRERHFGGKRGSSIADSVESGISNVRFMGQEPLHSSNLIVKSFFLGLCSTSIWFFLLIFLKLIFAKNYIRLLYYYCYY